MKNKIALIIITFTLIFIFSCERMREVSEDKRLKIVATLFPTYDFTRNIGRDTVEVSLLLPPGIESHSFEPRPGDIIRINSADIFIFTNKYMETWIDDILKGIDNKDLLIVDSSNDIKFIEEKDGHDHKHDHKKEKNSRQITLDPHIWLDIRNAKKMVDNILAGLIKKDPLNRDFYINNAEVYKSKLDALDQEFYRGLSNCKKDIFVHAGHFAFGYLSERYKIRYISAYKGVSPDSEPTPAMMRNIINIIKKYGLTYIFYEELMTPRLAEVISKETGVGLLKLHAIHNLSKDEFEKGETFISLMQQNLKNLRIGLQCQ